MYIYKLLVGLVGVCLLCCSCTPKRNNIVASQTDLENYSGSLIVRGLTIFGYENNTLSYQLKSKFMVESLNRDSLEFIDVVLQKLELGDNKGGTYLANKATYFVKENKVKMLHANLQENKNEVILIADSVLLDFSDYTLSGENAEVIRKDQKIHGSQIFYDIITGKLQLSNKVEGNHVVQDQAK